jgi:peptide deformylase
MAEEAGQVRKEKLDPEAEARRRLALAQIRQYPDPGLRMRAREIEDFDDDLARLAERLTALMQEANGLGLAAPQIGVLRRAFAFQPAPEDDARVIVNPQIVTRGDETESSDEGCLSMQGVTVPVERSLSVTLEGRTPSGEEIRLELEGLTARVVQHELDHLDGVLILDRTTPEARREALGILRPQPIIASV